MQRKDAKKRCKKEIEKNVLNKKGRLLKKEKDKMTE